MYREYERYVTVKESEMYIKSDRENKKKTCYAMRCASVLSELIFEQQQQQQR